MKFLLTILMLLHLTGLSSAQSIHITTLSNTVCTGTPVIFYTVDSGVVVPHYRWYINSTIVGGDSSVYHADSLMNNDVVFCLLLDSLGTIQAHSDSIKMVVMHTLSAGIITGFDTVCVGATITLTDTVQGGVWNMSNTVASVSGGVVTGVKVFSGLVPDDHETDTCFYITRNQCGADTASIHVVVEPLLANIFPQFLPPTDLCYGLNHYQDDVQVYYANFYSKLGIVTWGNDYFYGGMSAYGNAVGMDSVYYVAKNYCSYYSAGEWVTVEPPTSAGKIIPAENSVCVGDSISLVDTGYWGNLTWSVSNHLLASISATGKLLAKDSGVVVLTVTANNHCGLSQSSASVKINPLPKIYFANDTICNETNILLQSNISNGTWTSLNTDIATIGTQNNVASIRSIGEPLIKYTTLDGCSTIDTLVIIHCYELAEIYPNPSTGNEVELHLYYDGDFFCSIQDCIGQTILSQHLSGQYNFINVQSLRPRIYYLHVVGLSHSETIKFVKD